MARAFGWETFGGSTGVAQRVRGSLVALRRRLSPGLPLSRGQRGLATVHTVLRIDSGGRGAVASRAEQFMLRVLRYCLRLLLDAAYWCCSLPKLIAVFC
jgi:hypothetical protein